MSYTLDEFLDFVRHFGYYKPIKNENENNYAKSYSIQKNISNYPLTTLENTEKFISVSSHTKCRVMDILPIENSDEQLVTLAFFSFQDFIGRDLLDISYLAERIPDQATPNLIYQSKYEMIRIESNHSIILEANKDILDMFLTRNIFNGYPGYALSINMGTEIHITLRVKKENFNANRYTINLLLFDIEEYKKCDIDTKDILYGKDVRGMLECIALKINEIVEAQNSNILQKIDKLYINELQNEFEILRKHKAFTFGKRMSPLLIYRYAKYDDFLKDSNLIKCMLMRSFRWNINGFYIYVLIEGSKYDIFSVFEYIRVVETKGNQYDFSLSPEITFQFNEYARFVDIAKLFADKYNPLYLQETSCNMQSVKHWVKLYKTYQFPKGRDLEFCLEMQIRDEFRGKNIQLITISPEMNFAISDEYCTVLYMSN